MKKTRLAVESLESRELLAVTAGAVFSPVAAALPRPTSSEGVVSIVGTGESPSVGQPAADFTAVLTTSRSIASDFSSLSLSVGINRPGISVLSSSDFDPERAGFQLADPSLTEVPDITVTPLFTENLISNGSYAFYLHAGGEDAPVAGDWYLKAVWFDLSLSGDWSGGAETASTGVELVSFHLNFDPALVTPVEVKVDFAAECGENWTVSSVPYTVTVEPKTTADLVASAVPATVSVQPGCRFFLSGAGSYSKSGKPIRSWLWDFTGRGTPDASGEELWLAANDLKFTSGASSVSLTVGDAKGNLSLPADVSVTLVDVAPAVSGRLTSFVGGRVVLADLCYSDAAGTPGAFWQIDWGDGIIDEIHSLSNTLSVSHAYANAAAHPPVSVRVTGADGRTSSPLRID